MNTLQIDKAVTEINQKIVQSSIKKTNLNNPIKVLVSSIKILDFQRYYKVSKQKRRFKLDGFSLDLTCENFQKINKKILLKMLPKD